MKHPGKAAVRRSLNKLVRADRSDSAPVSQNVGVIPREKHDFAGADFNQGLAVHANKHPALGDDMIADDLRWKSRQVTGAFVSRDLDADAPGRGELPGKKHASREPNCAQHFGQRIHRLDGRRIWTNGQMIRSRDHSNQPRASVLVRRPARHSEYGADGDQSERAGSLKPKPTLKRGERTCLQP